MLHHPEAALADPVHFLQRVSRRRGAVYVMQRHGDPEGWVKVGRTRLHPAQRQYHLNNAGQRLPWVVFGYGLFLDSFAAEKDVFATLTQRGFPRWPGKEIFQVEPEVALSCIAQHELKEAERSDRWLDRPALLPWQKLPFDDPHCRWLDFDFLIDSTEEN